MQEQLRAWEGQLALESDPGSFLLILVPFLVAKHLGRWEPRTFQDRVIGGSVTWPCCSDYLVSQSAGGRAFLIWGNGSLS